MMKYKNTLFVLLLWLILCACQPVKENQSPDNLEMPNTQFTATSQPVNEAIAIPDNVKMNCHSETARTLASFEQIEPTMSFNDACAFIGLADEDVGSGLHIFLYHLEDASQILVGFASYDDPILYVMHLLADGTEEWLMQSEQ